MSADFHGWQQRLTAKISSAATQSVPEELLVVSTGFQPVHHYAFLIMPLNCRASVKMLMPSAM